MTDKTSFYRALVSQTAQFINSFEDLKLMSDRIGSDSFLSSQAATAAQAGGRSDLSAADFDNVKAAIDLVASTINSSSVQVNTGGTVKLAFYKML